MIVCAEPILHDFGVIVHEMGHLQYFMAFKEQPAIFQVWCKIESKLTIQLKWNSIQIGWQCSHTREYRWRNIPWHDDTASFKSIKFVAW